MKNRSDGQSCKIRSTQCERICIRIADVTYVIASVDPAMRLRVEEATKKFLIGESTPDMAFEARWDDLSALEPEGAEVFHSGSVWRLNRDGGDYIFTLTSPALGATPYKVVRLRGDFSEGEVRIHRPYFEEDEAVYPLEYPLDELLMTHFLASGKGVEFHATGVAVSSDRGYLFAGQSGAGKTTIARIWENRPGVVVLSDDRIVVRKMEGRLWMYGTPWHGDAELSCPDRIPLSGVFMLKHSRENRLTPLRPVAAAGRLFSCGFPPFHDRDAIEVTLGFLDDIVSEVACYDLEFYPDKEVVEFIERGATGA